MDKKLNTNFFQFHRHTFSKGPADIAASTGDHYKTFIIMMFTNQNPGKTLFESFVKIFLLNLLAPNILKHPR